MKLGLAPWWLATVLLVSAGCGDNKNVTDAGDTGPRASASIGPSGGTLAFGEVTMVVPAGALSTTRTLTITRVGDGTSTGYALRSSRYRFEPAGLAFAQPVTVTFVVSGDVKGAAVYWTRADSAEFERLPSVVFNQRVTAQPMHFSEGFVGVEPVEALDASVDAQIDGGTDAASDVAVDSARDAGSDAPTDSGDAALDGGAHDAAGDGAVSDGAASDGAVSDGALSDGAVSGNDAATDVSVGDAG